MHVGDEIWYFIDEQRAVRGVITAIHQRVCSIELDDGVTTHMAGIPIDDILPRQPIDVPTLQMLLHEVRRGRRPLFAQDYRAVLASLFDAVDHLAVILRNVKPSTPRYAPLCGMTMLHDE